MTDSKTNNTSDVPPPTPLINDIELNNICYNCTECSSLIEILSLNEDNNTIEFRCLGTNNNHDKKIISIKDYLEKMKNHIDINISRDKCEIHKNNNIYISYCFDCKHHLCKECLKNRTHIKHSKNNIIEIQPIKEELDIIEEIIKNYKNKIDNLKKEKKMKMEKLENNLNKCIKEEKKLLEENIRRKNKRQ